MTVQRLVHRLGYRYRLHVKALPGTPDLVFPRLRKIINVHGCFWHLHTCPHARVAPASNASYWRKKREGNAARDKRNLAKLRRAGWSALTVWECRIRNADALAARVANFLESGKPSARAGAAPR